MFCISIIFHGLVAFFTFYFSVLLSHSKCNEMLFRHVQIDFMSSLHSNGLGRQVPDDAVRLIWTEIFEDCFQLSRIYSLKTIKAVLRGLWYEQDVLTK